MKPSSNPIFCDGCGQPATPEHIAARVQRLELATRFRPIHVGVLFVAMAPPVPIEGDFYDVESLSEGRDRLLTAIGIPASAKNRVAPSANPEAATTRLNEFQHRGHYLTYLFECPLATTSEDGGLIADQLVRRSTTLVKRIRFNYKPRHIALLGAEVAPLIQILTEAGLGELLLLDRGAPLAIPGPGNVAADARFLEALSEKAPGSSSAAMV
jgi:hypothetical protein